MAHGFTGGLSNMVIQTPPPAQDSSTQLPEQGLIGAGEVGKSRQSFSNKVIQKGPAAAPGAFWRCQAPIISRARRLTLGVGVGFDLLDFNEFRTGPIDIAADKVRIMLEKIKSPLTPL